MNPGQIWRDILPPSRCKQHGESDFLPFEKEVLTLLQKANQSLFDGEKNITLNEREVSALVKQVAPISLSTRERFDRTRYLIEGLELGIERLGWDLKISRRIQLLTREKNLLNEQTVPLTNHARDLEQAFLQDLETPLPVTPQERFGQILLSSVLFGGLLQRGFLEAFPQAWNYKHIYKINDWLWMDLWRIPLTASADPPDRFARQTDNKEYRRWFPDPLTQLLIETSLEKFPATIYSGKPWTYISAYLGRLNLPPSKCPSALTKLLHWANARATLTLQPFLSSYARGILASSSLPDEAWLRLLTGKTYHVPKVEDSSSTPSPDDIDHKIYPHRNYNTHKQVEFLKTLLNRIHTTRKSSPNDPKERIKIFRERWKGQLCPSLQLLARWAHRLLSEAEDDRERRAGYALPSETVRSYVRTIGEALVIIAADCNLLDLELDEFELLYEEVAEFIQQNHRPRQSIKKRKDEAPTLRKALYKLRQFHGFLMTDYRHIPEVDFSEFDADLKGNGRVDANLLTPVEFSTVLASLGWNLPKLTRLQRQNLLAAILGYRTGMRRGEIQGLRLLDVQGKEELEILIRRNRLRRIKTVAARRRIPAHALLPAEELEFLKSWLGTRLRETNDNTDKPLFTISRSSTEKMDDKELFDPVRNALRAVTDDQTIKFHHLRHSFVSLFILRLMRHLSPLELMAAENYFAEFSEADNTKLDSLIYDNEWTGRKALYASVVITGHADVATNLKHYNHVVDWLLGMSLRHTAHCPQLTANAITALTGCPRWQANQLLRLESNPLLTFLKAHPSRPHPLLEKGKEITLTEPKEMHEIDFDQALDLYLDKNTHALDLPSRPTEVSFVENIYNLLFATANGPETFLEGAAILHVCRRDRYRDYWIIDFKQAELAINFLNTCVPQEHVLYTIHLPRKNGKHLGSRNAKAWRELLPESHKTSPIKYSNIDNDSGSLSIEVKEKTIKSPAKSSPRNSSGFRFLLDMLSWLEKEGHL